MKNIINTNRLLLVLLAASFIIIAFLAGKNQTLNSEIVKQKNLKPTLSPTVIAPTLSPTLIPSPTAIQMPVKTQSIPTTTPVPTPDKSKLNKCLQDADNAYYAGWEGSCKQIQDFNQKLYDDCKKDGGSDEICKYNLNLNTGNRCNLPTASANFLTNQRATAKNNCYSAYQAGIL